MGRDMGLSGGGRMPVAICWSVSESASHRKMHQPRPGRDPIAIVSSRAWGTVALVALSFLLSSLSSPYLSVDRVGCCSGLGAVSRPYAEIPTASDSHRAPAGPPAILCLRRPLSLSLHVSLSARPQDADGQITHSGERVAQCGESPQCTNGDECDTHSSTAVQSSRQRTLQPANPCTASRECIHPQPPHSTPRIHRGVADSSALRTVLVPVCRPRTVCGSSSKVSTRDKEAGEGS